MGEAQQKEAELKRSDSQELLFVEAEKDIGELCDLIGDDEQAPEDDDEDQNVRYLKQIKYLIFVIYC